MATSTLTEGPEEFTCFLSLGGPFEPGYVRIDSNKSEFLAFVSSGEKILHLQARDIQVVNDNWTLPSSVTVTSGGPPDKELVITHLLNKERLVSVFKMMGKWQEDSESIESSPSPCTRDADRSGMNEESLATVDLESPPGSPKPKPHPVIPLSDQEPKRPFPTPNEPTTDPKLAQLLDMFPEEDSETLSKLLKVCGGDVTHAVDAMLSGQVPDVPQVKNNPCKEVFQKYEDKFLGNVDTHAIAKLLEIKKVIPGDLCFKLERTGNDEATEMLFLHMKDHGSLETVRSLCDVMIGKEGYPKMNSLGRDMKEDLPTLKRGELGRECVANEQREDHPVNAASLALYGAVAGGNISEVETIVQKCRNMPGFDVDFLFEGHTPLHIAAKSGYVDIVEKLVELGCNIDKNDSGGVTALHHAAGNGHVDVVAKLIKLGCDMNKTEKNGWTALHHAAYKGHVDVVAELVKLAEQGCVGVVAKLVELGFDMNKTDNNGLTALHAAAVGGHVDVIAKLIEFGCDMNKTEGNGWTALHIAALKGHVDVVAKLVEHGCDMNKTDNSGFTALHHAVLRDHVGVVAKLVEFRCDINQINVSNGFTALHYAAIHSHVDVVAKLVKFGCNVSKANNNGMTALHCGADNGHVDVIAKLVELRCDVNERDLFRRTALHIAAFKGHVKAVTKLIELGCDMNATVIINEATALHLAALMGRVDVIAELVHHGMDVNVTAKDGTTALHIAAREGHVNVVTKLIELGCDRNKTDTQGQTALDFAQAAGHIDIVAKLIC